MTRKVTNFIKQYFFMLALAGMFVGFSAFKFAKTLDDPEDGWYEVYVELGDDPNDPTDQKIGIKLTVDPDETNPSQCAQFDNEGHLCAIELVFHQDENNEYPDMPTTVQEADDEDLVDIEGEAREPDQSR